MTVACWGGAGNTTVRMGMVEEKGSGPSRVCCWVSSHRRQMKLKAAGKLKKLQKQSLSPPSG